MMCLIVLKIKSFLLLYNLQVGMVFHLTEELILLSPPSLFHDQPNDGNKTVPISLTFFEPHHTSNLNLNDVYSLVCIESFW